MWYNGSISVNENGGADTPPPLTTTVGKGLVMADIDITTQNATEEWRDVPGYRGYQVSSLGRVRSGWYPTSKGRHFNAERQKFLKPNTRKTDGYQKLVLVDSDGAQHTLYLHNVVLLAFVGECPDGMECRHFDGDPSNNRLSNLLYGTRIENAQDRIRHGTSTRGKVHNTTKLTLVQVAQIKARIASGESDTSIAKDYPVTRGEIHHIRSGVAWGWLNE